MTHAKNDNDELRPEVDESEADNATDIEVRSPSEVIETAGATTEIDMSGLPPEEAAELRKQWIEKRIDLAEQAHSAELDVRSLGANLGTLTDSASQASEQNISTTISHSQTTKNSRTEVMIGNTERAAQGKLSKSVTGETDWKPYYIIGGIVAVSLIGIALANSL